MLELSENIATYGHMAPPIIFFLILLAGLNIPISLDALMVLSAVLASRFFPDTAIHFYLSILFGSLFSAWISYWFGRLVGPRLQKLPFFAKWMPPSRLEKVHQFFARHGAYSLLIGRFVPFGMRNALFMSCGMSRLSFTRFALFDALACFVWASSLFTLFFYLGENFETLLRLVKKGNIAIFCAFSVSLIGVIWYKKAKKRSNGSKSTTLPSREEL